MKIPLRFLALIIPLLTSCVFGGTASVTVNTPNADVRYPLTFFSVNSNLLNSSIYRQSGLNVGVTSASVMPLYNGVDSQYRLLFRQIEAGTNILLQSTATTVKINSTATGGSLTTNLPSITIVYAIINDAVITNLTVVNLAASVFGVQTLNVDTMNLTVPLSANKGGAWDYFSSSFNVPDDTLVPFYTNSISVNSTHLVTAKLVGGGDTASFGAEMRAVIRRTAGSASLVNLQNIMTDAGMAYANIGVSVAGGEYILEVGGTNTEDMNWSAKVDALNVSNGTGGSPDPLLVGLMYFQPMEGSTWSPSVGSPALNMNGTVATDTGFNGNAMGAVTTPDYLWAADSANFSIPYGSDFTIACRVYLNVTTGYGYAFTKSSGGTAATTEYSLWLDSAVPKLTFDVENGSGFNQISSQTVTTTTWYHCVLTYTASSQTLALNVNGTAATPVVISGAAPLDTAFSLYFGSDKGVSNFFDGRVDDFAFWNRKLGAGEITTYQAGWAP